MINFYVVEAFQQYTKEPENQMDYKEQLRLLTKLKWHQN